MTIEQIRNFLSIANTLNFTQSAQELYLGQPNLSKQIIAMERELEMQLFIRDRRHVELTPEGRLLAQQLRAIPVMVQDAIDAAKSLHYRDASRLNFGILSGQKINGDVHNIMDRIYAQIPDMRITFERACYRDLRVGLSNGRFDAIFTMSFDVAGLNGLYVHKVTHLQHAIAINRSNPLASKEDLSLLDLDGETLFTVREEITPPGYHNLFEMFKRIGFTPRRVELVNNVETPLFCVESGMGIMIIDRNTWLEDSPYVRIVDLPWESSQLDLTMVWRKDKHKPVLDTIFEN